MEVWRLCRDNIYGTRCKLQAVQVQNKKWVKIPGQTTTVLRAPNKSFSFFCSTYFILRRPKHNMPVLSLSCYMCIKSTLNIQTWDNLSLKLGYVCILLHNLTEKGEYKKLFVILQLHYCVEKYAHYAPYSQPKSVIIWMPKIKSFWNDGEGRTDIQGEILHVPLSLISDLNWKPCHYCHTNYVPIPILHL